MGLQGFDAIREPYRGPLREQYGSSVSRMYDALEELVARGSQEAERHETSAAFRQALVQGELALRMEDNGRRRREQKGGGR
jgi:hypothetical protein